MYLIKNIFALKYLEAENLKEVFFYLQKILQTLCYGYML